MTRSRSFSRSSARFGRWLSSNALDSTRMIVGPLAQHLGETAGRCRPALGVSAENPVRLVVHQRERAVAVERDDAVAHAADEVAEEPVVGGRAAARDRRRRRSPAPAARGWAAPLGRGAGRWGVSGMAVNT